MLIYDIICIVTAAYIFRCMNFCILIKSKVLLLIFLVIADIKYVLSKIF